MNVARALRASSFRGASRAATVRRGVVASIAGGALFALTAPPTDLAVAVFAGLSLLAYAVATAPTAASAFRRGALWGTAAGVIGLRFVPLVIERFTPLPEAAGYLALVLLAGAQSLAWAAGAATAHIVARRLRAPLELAFAAGVFLATLVPTVFAWTPAGLLAAQPELVQLADTIGERGVSSIIGALGALSVRAVRRIAMPGRPFLIRAQRAGALAVPLVLALTSLFKFGQCRMSQVERSREAKPSLRVALVDQSVGATERWEYKNRPRILSRLRELTRKAERAGAELVVWPEAAHPYVVPHGTRALPRGPMSPLYENVRGPILVGLITKLEPSPIPGGGFEQLSRNSASLLSPDGTLSAPYDKLALLWFGEMVPLGDELPWLRRMFHRGGGLVPGTEARALALPAPPRLATAAQSKDIKLGVLNCYEDTLATIGRRVALEARPALLVNVTNDAWFFETAEPELHARLATMRAIELRKDLVRAVNRGVTSAVSASGRTLARREPEKPEVVHVEPKLDLDRSPTLYARCGDTPLAAAFAAAAIGTRLTRRRRRGLSAP